MRHAVSRRLPALSGALAAVFLAATALRTHNDTSVAIAASSVAMFACCWASATHLLGARAALRFAGLALLFGWGAEQMGVSHGWFFGRYVYTGVLGLRLGDVPLVIPLMWFALSYTGYVLANLIVLRSPVDAGLPLGQAAVLSLLAALLVTAYDLGADPYMVYKLKAWTMARTDGAWFGETLQGFVGWACVSFAIVFGFRLGHRGRAAAAPAAPFGKWHVCVPLLLYAGSMLFQIANGDPVETRTIALFVMGIPLLSALAGWRYWSLPAGAAAERAT